MTCCATATSLEWSRPRVAVHQRAHERFPFTALQVSIEEHLDQHLVEAAIEGAEIDGEIRTDGLYRHAALLYEGLL